MRPRNIVTVLGTHDGIGVLDVEGLHAAQEISALMQTIHERSHEGRIASGSAAANVDTSQINCTFYDALGRGDVECLVAARYSVFRPGNSPDRVEPNVTVGTTEDPRPESGSRDW